MSWMCIESDWEPIAWQMIQKPGPPLPKKFYLQTWAHARPPRVEMSVLAPRWLQCVTCYAPARCSSARNRI